MVSILRISKHTWCQINASLEIVIDDMIPAIFFSCKLTRRFPQQWNDLDPLVVQTQTVPNNTTALSVV